MQEMAFPGFKFQNVSGDYAPRPPPPPIHAWYVGHTHGLSPLLYPLIYYLTERSLFKNDPPPREILKKGPASWTKDGVRISYTGYEEGLLSLRNISKTARRTYKCVAQSHTLTDEISIEIIIQYCISILIISLKGLFFLPKCFNLE